MLPFGILYPKNYASDPTNSGKGYPLIVMLCGSVHYGYHNTSQFGTDVDAMNSNTSYRYNNFDCFVLLPEWFGERPWVNPSWPDGESDPEINPMLNSDSDYWNLIKEWTAGTSDFWSSYALANVATPYDGPNYYNGSYNKSGWLPEICGTSQWDSVCENSWFCDAIEQLIRDWIADAHTNLAKDSYGYASEEGDVHLDSDRIYVGGFSLGGLFAYQIIRQARDLFAAAVIEGGWPVGNPYVNHFYSGESGYDPDALWDEWIVKHQERVKHIPILLLAGANSGMAYGNRKYKEVAESQATADSRICNVHLVLVTGQGHNILPLQRAFMTTSPTNNYTFDTSAAGSQDYVDQASDNANGIYTGLEWLFAQTKSNNYAMVTPDPYPLPYPTVPARSARQYMQTLAATYDGVAVVSQFGDETPTEIWWLTGDLAANQDGNSSACNLQWFKTTVSEFLIYQFGVNSLLWDKDKVGEVTLTAGDKVDFSEGRIDYREDGPKYRLPSKGVLV
ncbi:MAG: hypothetical protein GWO86_02955 [Planctomycetes bacterium]|nr:hypothetical protein [Planctomycetota bacterium]